MTQPDPPKPPSEVLRQKREAVVREMARYLTGVFTHNLGLKGISFLLACALWFHVNLSSQEQVVGTLYLPVQLYNLDDKNLTVDMPSGSKTVTAVVRGRRIDLIFKQEHIHVGVNLRNIRSPLGDVTLPVETVVPSYFDLQSFEPRSVVVTIKGQTKPRED